MAYKIIDNIETMTRENTDFRKVIFTSQYTQLVIMSLVVGQDIGEEVHTLDQFIRIEEGTGQALLDGTSHQLLDGSAVIIPAGVRHNIINVGDCPLKLYTLYSPPEHHLDTVQKEKPLPNTSEEHFDGQTNV